MSRNGTARSVPRFAIVVMVLGAGSAAAQTGANTRPVERGPVVCRSKSLTVCQDDFCFVTFDRSADQRRGMWLDTARMMYRVNGVDQDWKGMIAPRVEETPGHLGIKFGIKLAHGTPANVQFIAKRKNDAAVDMTAAVRSAYPATTERSAIIPLTAYDCAAEP